MSNSFYNKVKTLMADMEWYIAIREYVDEPIEEQKEFKFKILRNTWRYWCADPFLIEKDGVTYIFMEIYDRFTQKGKIGYRTYIDGRVSKLHICMDSRYHYSYPYVFEKEGSIYMIPECHKSNNLSVYKAICFPNKWELVNDIITGKMVCDTNFLENEDGTKLLLTMELDHNLYCYDKLCLYYYKDREWKYSENNPIVIGEENARNGGAIFKNKTRKIRPAQNCKDSYGKNLSFYQIIKADKDCYEEKQLCQMFVEDIIVTNSKKKFDGMHTYNTNYKFEVIDLRIENVLQTARVVYLLRCRIKKIWRKIRGTTD